jgi:hypothetical protein
MVPSLHRTVEVAPSAYPASDSFGRVDGVRHNYLVVAQSANVSSASDLVLRGLPYAAARFGLVAGVSLSAIAVFALALYGFRLHWFVGIALIVAAGLGATALWQLGLANLFTLIQAGHTMVQTELITRGHCQNRNRNLFAHGRREVLKRFGQLPQFIGFRLFVTHVILAFNRNHRFEPESLPVPN